MDKRQGIMIATYLGNKLKQSEAKITVVVDGDTCRVPFGRPFLATAPGTHEVSVYWGLQPPKARPVMQVEVREGEVTRLRWRGPRFIWQKGELGADSSEEP